MFENPDAFFGLYRHFEKYNVDLIQYISQSIQEGSQLTIDLGCGVGNFTAAIASKLRSKKTIGADSSPAFVDFANKRFKSSTVSFVCSDARDFLSSTLVAGADLLIMKGSFHLFEASLSVGIPASQRLPKLRTAVTIEKTSRSLATYPVPKSAVERREKYIKPRFLPSSFLRNGSRDCITVAFGREIEVPTGDYLSAIQNRQLSYLSEIGDLEMNDWVESVINLEFVNIFEENIAEIFFY